MIEKRKIKLSEAWRKVDFSKPSTWMIVFSNVIVIFFAIVDNLSAFEVLWIYWFQSVIIGVFNFIRIISLKEFTTTGFRRSGNELPPTKAAKFSTAIFLFNSLWIFPFCVCDVSWRILGEYRFEHIKFSKQLPINYIIYILYKLSDRIYSIYPNPAGNNS